VNRRDFLSTAIKAFFTLLGIITGVIALLFSYPSRIRRPVIEYFPVMDEDELPRRGVRTVTFRYTIQKKVLTSRAFVVNHKGSVYVLSPVCTHLGCLVNWHRKKNQFLCPCHGGKYDIEGRVVDGPPPKPLTRLPFRISDGKLHIGMKV